MKKARITILIVLALCLGGTGRYLVIYVILVAGMAFLFLKLPSSFLPKKDQVLLTMVQLPPGSTQEQTVTVLSDIEEYYRTKEKANVKSVFTVSDFDFAGKGQNMGLAFVVLQDWKERHSNESHVSQIINRANLAFSKIQEAIIFSFNIPVMSELGTAQWF
ncbi:MAG: efflux RND transporter permease subunit [Candidatus Phlomobacter fragariae]